ncbi:hypothetical protein BTZ20_1590 [Rhodococcus sp. MTM3W5.2]|nr:hypothetical protein BTZ20_1590 [Rhodococcus sp. MTM3W5.2]
MGGVTPSPVCVPRRGPAVETDFDQALTCAVWFYVGVRYGAALTCPL